MKNYRIRQFGPETVDTDQITELNVHFFPYSPWLEFENTHWFIAYDGGAPWTNPMAFAGVQFLEGEAFLCRCAVGPQFRNKGLQRTFIRKRTQLCAANGIKNIYTYTSVDNVASMRNLISNKFRPCHFPGKHWIGTYLDSGEEYVYWKKEYEL